MTEKRRFLRFETALSAFCETASGKIKAATNVKNISKEGALLLIDKPVREGTGLNLSMDIPGDNVPIVAAGRVAWQKEVKRSGGHSIYETGVKFIDINNVDKGRLLEYIYTQWLRILDNVK